MEQIYRQMIRMKSKLSKIDNRILKFRRITATERSEFREHSVIVKLQMRENVYRRLRPIKVSM